MAISLNKGSRFNLAKEAPQLKVAGVGLGWNPNETLGGPIFDLDVSAFLLSEGGKIPADEYAIFYNSVNIYTKNGEVFDREQARHQNKKLLENSRPISGDYSVLGAEDSIEGSESDGGDDEDMRIYFDKVDDSIIEIAIAVSISKYPNDVNKDRRTLALNFGMVSDCYIRVWDDETGNEIFRYNLNESFSNQDALEFGRFYRVSGSWEFVASGKSFVGSLQKLVELFT